MWLIFLIFGIVYALRRPRLMALEASNFPEVPVDKFEEWKTFERKSVDIFLWATWGLFIISIPVSLLLATSFPGGTLGLQMLFVFLFVALLVISAVFGSKGAKLKKTYGIKWP